MSRNLQLQVVLSALDKATAPLKAITKSSAGLGAQLKQTRDQLKGLQGQQSNIQSFKALKEASEQSKKAMAAQQQKVKELSMRMREADTPTKALTKEFQHAAREAHRLKQNHSGNTQQLQAMRGKLNEAGISTKKLGEAERALRGRISETNQSLTEQQNRLKRVTDQQKRLSAAKSQYERTQQLASSMATTGAAGIGVAYGIKSSAERIIAPGIEYGAQMSELQAVSRLGKDDDRFKMLKQQARELGASTAFSATEVGGGQTFLARAGFSPEAINSSMQDILDLALANGVDLARTADIASNISGAFKIDPEVEGNMRRVSDILSGVSARANVDLEMLGDTMKYLGKAEGLNMSLEQTAAMAGVLGNIGIQSSQAGTTMRAMLDRITAPAAAGAKAMAALGLEVKDAAGNMRDMPAIIADVASATSKMGNVDQAKYLKDIFGAEAGSGMAELVAQQGTGGLSKLIEELYNVQGENARMAATRADNIDGDLKGLWSAWEEIGIGITDINEGPLRGLVQQITSILRAVGQWAQKNPALVATLAKTVAVIGVLAGAGGAFMLTLGSLLGPIALVKYAMVVFGIKSLGVAAAFKGIGAAVMVLGKALLASPLGLFAVIAAGAAYLIIKNWDLVKAFFKGFAGGFASGFMDMGRALIDSFKPVVPVLKAIMQAGGKALAWIKGLLAPVTATQKKLEGATSAGKAFGQALGALAALTVVALAIKAVGTAVLFMGKAVLANPIVAVIVAIAAAAYLIYKNWEPIKAFFADLWQSIKSLFGSAVAFFAELGGGMVAAFKQGLSAAWAGITEFFSNRWADIKTAFGGGISGVGALILNWSPLGLFYQVFAGVMSYFGVDLPGKFSEFGAMIMQGLINGIKNMGGAVKDAVVGMGNGVTGWFKDKLGIKSPSRVFMQLGDDTAEGLALGINANKDSPLKQVASMAKQVAAAGAIALGVSVTPAVADNNQRLKQNLQPAAIPEVQDQQQRILQSVQSVTPPATQDQQQQVKQSLQVAAIPAVQDQQQRILQSVQPVALPPVPAVKSQRQSLPVLTQNIQQMIISAKQVLPDLTQRIIGVFSDPKMAAGSLQQKLAIEQPAIAFDTRAPIASPAAQRSAPQAASNITINVHPSPGMDEALLAQLVQRELEKAQRQQQVRTRSRIGDLD